MPVSQRAIFPVSLVGVMKVLANFSIISRNWAAVTVTFSCGGCANAVRIETKNAAEQAKIRTIFASILLLQSSR